MKVTAMHHSREIKARLVSFLFIFLVAVCGSQVGAQQEPKSEPQPKKSVREAPGRDPFRRYEPTRVVLKKSAQIAAPSLQQRIEQYRVQKMVAMNAHMPPPKPTTALLLSEVQVVGISRTPRGYAAIVEATPIKLSYVVYPGERFYDGQLVAIDDARLVFRRETVWSDGRRERSVENKSLRQVNPIEAMSAVKAAPASSTPVADSEKKPEDKAPTPDKP